MADTIEAGKKCAPGKTRDRKSGLCRKKKCRGSKVRGKSGRCHQPKGRKMHGGEILAGNCGMYGTQGSQGSRRQMGGGAFELADAPDMDSGVLTAGALEEAFQAGFEAGKRRRASRRKSHKKSARKSHKKSAKKSRRSRKSQRKRSHRKVKGGDAVPQVSAGTTEPVAQVEGGESIPQAAPIDA